jgi:molybdopterin molybdotransferase
MDGFAVRTSDVSGERAMLRVIGELPAGRPAEGVRVGAGEAVRIFTGGVMPEGADAVVMVEVTEESADRSTVVVLERPTPGQHVRRRGEDLMSGSTVLAAGARIDAAAAAALSAVGATRVRVIRPPRVAVVSTGTEIVDADDAPARHQVRNSNARMLVAALHAMRLVPEDLGIVVDEPSRLDEAFARALAADVLLISGGVSVGDYDFVHDALRRAGCEVLFHRVAMRPGKPILAARTRSCLVLGLPGNPVSAFTSFQVFAVPALRRLMGDPDPVAPRLRATLLDGFRGRPGRESYQLARLTWRDGRPLVTPVRSASSGDVLALPRANAFIVVPADAPVLEAGVEAEVMTWSG